MLSMITKDDEETLMRDIRFYFFSEHFPFAAEYDTRFLDKGETSHLSPEIQANFQQYIENLDFTVLRLDFIYKKIYFICCHILDIPYKKYETTTRVEIENIISNSEKEHLLLTRLGSFFSEYGLYEHELLQKFDIFWQSKNREFQSREQAAMMFLLKSEQFNEIWLDYANLY